ncbi:MAG: hypothetical protein D6767_07115 [Candidatus Hydrogenedentota bacterium]|nr:MAG: hypothetical protein D6767_07115 [Candidatus Hydrogenedentota bacterium]
MRDGLKKTCKNALSLQSVSNPKEGTMKVKFNKIIMSMLMVVLAMGLTTIQNAQTKKSKEKSEQTGEQDIPASYLDVFHAKEKAFSLRVSNRKDIYRLKIIVANFGDSETKPKFDKILKDYKEGVKVLYKNKFVQASKLLEENRKNIRELYAIFSRQYHNKAAELLNECADLLVETELSESIEPGSANRSKDKLIRKIRNRLSVAYAQLNLGSEFENLKNYPEAVAHFRVAKYHGIQILKELAETEEDKRKIEKKYAVDLADAENMVAKKSSKSS